MSAVAITGGVPLSAAQYSRPSLVTTATDGWPAFRRAAGPDRAVSAVSERDARTNVHTQMVRSDARAGHVSMKRGKRATRNWTHFFLRLSLALSISPSPAPVTIVSLHQRQQHTWTGRISDGDIINANSQRTWLHRADPTHPHRTVYSFDIT